MENFASIKNGTITYMIYNPQYKSINSDYVLFCCI